LKFIQVEHNSVSPYISQLYDKDPLRFKTGFSMEYCREIAKRYPGFEFECWRPERTARSLYTWYDEEDKITHRVFPSTFLRYNFEYSPGLIRAVKEIRDSQQTFLWFHGNYNWHSYWLAPTLKVIPSIAQSHAGFPARIMLKNSPHRFVRYLYLVSMLMEKWAFPQYPHVFAISNEEKKYLQHNYRLERVSFSPMGVDFNKFSPTEKDKARRACGISNTDKTILYVGRFSPAKGIEYLIQALPIIASQYPEVRLFLAGSGPLEASLRSLVQQLGCEARVSFIGYCPNNQLPDWYRAADVTVMPSLLEWFGKVAVESMACGTPAVVTNRGGPPDIVREFECGVLVPTKDPAAIARAVMDVFSNAVNTRPNIERARAAFDWDVRLEQAMSLFGKMVK